MFKFFFKAFAVFIAAASLLSLIFMLDKSVWKVENVQIVAQGASGQNFLFSQIKERLAPMVNSQIGKYVWDVNLENLLDFAVADKRVLAVRVERKFPNKVFLNIEPQMPLITLLDKKGQFRPITNKGELLRPLPLGEGLDTPILRGLNLQKSKELRLQAIELVKKIPSKGLLSQNRISEIHVHKKYGYVVYLLGNGGQVRLGNEDISLKIQQAERVLAYLESKKQTPRVLDARFPSKVVVKLRK